MFAECTGFIQLSTVRNKPTTDRRISGHHVTVGCNLATISSKYLLPCGCPEAVFRTNGQMIVLYHLVSLGPFFLRSHMTSSRRLHDLINHPPFRLTLHDPSLLEWPFLTLTASPPWPQPISMMEPPLSKNLRGLEGQHRFPFRPLIAMNPSSQGGNFGAIIVRDSLFPAS